VSNRRGLGHKFNMKPKKMWADYDPDHSAKQDRMQVYTTRSEQRSNRPDLPAIPVLVVPIDAESVEELREKIDRAVNESGDWSFDRKPSVEQITASVLAKLGITAPRRKKR